MNTIEVPRVTKKSWSDGAYTIAFIYSNKGNFILKGYSGDVRAYLNTKDINWFGNFTYYCNGETRNHWLTNQEGVYISKPTLRKYRFYPDNRYHFIITKYGTTPTTTIKLKRLPKRYIPEIFDTVR